MCVQHNVMVLIIKQLLRSSSQCGNSASHHSVLDHQLNTQACTMGRKMEFIVSRHGSPDDGSRASSALTMWRSTRLDSRITLHCIVALLNGCTPAHSQRLMAAARCFVSLQPPVAHQREPLCRPLSLCTAALRPTQTASSTSSSSFLNTCFSLIHRLCFML